MLVGWLVGEAPSDGVGLIVAGGVVADGLAVWGRKVTPGERRGLAVAVGEEELPPPQAIAERTRVRTKTATTYLGIRPRTV